jgi:hypothetical protein
MQTQDDAVPAPRSLPEIPLAELSATTKDFLLAHSAGGKSVPEVIIGVLDRAASAAGFEPNKAA